jgi:high-affinity Fe2+/Pb2+ permease
LSDIHHLNAWSTYPDRSIAEKGAFMLAISVMSATPTAIFYIVAVVLFILAGIGFKPAGDRVHLVGLGLAAAFFVVMWNALAAT